MKSIPDLNEVCKIDHHRQDLTVNDLDEEARERLWFWHEAKPHVPIGTDNLHRCQLVCAVWHHDAGFVANDDDRSQDHAIADRTGRPTHRPDETTSQFADLLDTRRAHGEEALLEIPVVCV